MHTNCAKRQNSSFLDASSRNLVFSRRSAIKDKYNFSEEINFNYLVSQLEPKYVENIWDIVTSNSATKYSEPKTTLLYLFKESERTRIKKT